MAHGVTVIKLGGEKRTICFNNHCIMFIGQACKCDPAQVDSEIMKIAEKNPLRALTFLIYGGLMGYLESEAIYDHDITLKQVSTWVGDADVEEFNGVWDVFMDTLKLPKATQEQIREYEASLAEDPTKKKPKQKKSNFLT